MNTFPTPTCNRIAISDLPGSMKEKAIKARKLSLTNPVEFCNEFLPWVWCEDENRRLSFDGNYSSISPADKIKGETRRKKASERYALMQKGKAIRAEAVREAWNKARQQVLDRDNRTCQLCGRKAESNLHIHHIMKRRDGGTDFLDNLLTVCSRCHKKADGSLYDPDWSVAPK